MDYHNLLWEIQLTRQNGKGWQRVLNTFEHCSRRKPNLHSRTVNQLLLGLPN